MSRIETSLELEFPAESPEQLLLALVVRDLLHGSSYDVEDEEGRELAADYSAGDEIDGSVYRLLISAEVEGTDDPEMVGELTEQIVDELIAEAEALVADRSEVAVLPLEELDFLPVPEEAERWDLVVPDWLAPDGAEVPFGFRPFRAEDGAPWPDDTVLDAHGRVVLVERDGTVRLFAVAAPSDDEEHAAES
jgi:hypothetical protein